MSNTTCLENKLCASTQDLSTGESMKSENTYSTSIKFSACESLAVV